MCYRVLRDLFHNPKVGGSIPAPRYQILKEIIDSADCCNVAVLFPKAPPASIETFKTLSLWYSESVLNRSPTHDLTICHKQIGQPICGGRVTPGKQSDELIATGKQWLHALSLGLCIVRSITLIHFCT